MCVSIFTPHFRLARIEVTPRRTWELRDKDGGEVTRKDSQPATPTQDTGLYINKENTFRE